jgi:hypothetical protein
VLNAPQGIWAIPSGDVFFTDSGNNLVRRLIFGQNWLVTIAGNASFGHGGDGGPALSAQLASPTTLTADSSGHIFVTDGDLIRRLTPQFLLKTAVNPSNGGTITAGGYFDAGTSVTVSASAAVGFTFTGFSGDATGTAPASVTMSATRAVVANFAPLNPSLLGAVTTKTDGPGQWERDYTLRLTNVGLGPGTNCAVTAATLVRTAGSGTATLLALPVPYGTLAVGAQASQILRATVPTTVLRFNLTVTGSCQNAVGATVPFTSTVSVFR